MKKRKIIMLCCLLLTTSLFSQKAGYTDTPPLKIPLYLSGNFGELRGSHFHAGIDFKTNQEIGHKLYSIDNGYVSRISVSPRGYGHALYITHPNGLTSVYAHMLSFVPNIDSIVKAKQYEQQSFCLDMELTPELLPVKQGELIGLSGNSGSSGGPHLHFEIRDTESQHPQNPLFYGFKIEDRVKPRIFDLMAYPVKDRGVIDSTQEKRKYKPSSNEKYYQIPSTIQAWGDIYFGIRANDYMTGTSNIFGMYKMSLWMDSVEIFSIQFDELDFSKNRAINAMIDYEEWKEKRTFFIKTLLPQTNVGAYYASGIKNSGIATINEERIYKFKYILTDYHGNTTMFPFNVSGVKAEIPVSEKTGVKMNCKEENVFDNGNFKIVVPKESLYEDIYFNLIENNDLENMVYAPAYTLKPAYTPLHNKATVSIRVINDTFPDKSKYYVGELDDEGRYSYIGGKYNEGFMDVSLLELVDMSVFVDTIPPSIRERKPVYGKQNMSFVIEDKETRISTYNAYVDDKWALLEYDEKNKTATYFIDSSRIDKNTKHRLRIEITDACGNKTEYDTTFFY